MTNKKSTKRALLVSAMAMVICFTMLLGTTFAWFTDSVTSSNNIIKSGTLEVGMYWAEGKNDPSTITTDASTGAIFNYDNWEPAYTEAKHIKIVNEGSLELNYKLLIEANGTVSELANVIDVYYFDNATQITRVNATSGTHLGTLADILSNTTKNISETVKGSLTAEGTAGDTTTLTLVFVMDKEAGNYYQNMSIGTDFSIHLVATQRAAETDGIGTDYDNLSPWPNPNAPDLGTNP